MRRRQPGAPAPNGRQPLAGIIAAIAVALLVLTGCSPSHDKKNSGQESAGPHAAVYDQDVDWSSCFHTFQCATVEVPLDWNKADSDTIDISVVRTPPQPEDKGTILIDPGGPGGSGVDIVADSLENVSTKRLRDNYTIAGFDPRGVGRSTAVKCFDDAQRDRMRSNDADPDTADGLADLRRMYKKFAHACQKHTGDLLGHVGTKSAARDMDVLRAAFDESKLNYLGFSYGTMLGATYAQEYPDHVGRFVLDGALDPSLTTKQVTLGQARGFERELKVYVKRCRSKPGCPLTGSTKHGVNQIRKLIADAAKSPMRSSSGRDVGAGLLSEGIIAALYNDANWQYLTKGLAAALHGDPDTLLMLADASADRDSSGHYTSNGDEAFIAINCLDYSPPTDTSTMRKTARAVEKASPTFGEQLSYTGVTCSSWPYDAKRSPHEVHAKGAGPFLVIGTTGDPATPYTWAKSLAQQLSGGRLLTWNGEGHTAYGRAGACINKKVDGYFLNGRLPDRGTSCPG